MVAERVNPTGPDAPASVLLAHYPHSVPGGGVACRCGARFQGGMWEREWAEHAVGNLWPAMEAAPF